jgi:uncharacterized protein YbjT (DUF2867 family)
MITVTGATGNVGRSLVALLAASGERVLATSRGISAADVPAGVDHQRADLIDAESLRPALTGAKALFLQNGGASAQLIDAHHILEVARSSGVERVVLLSSQGVVTRPDSASHGEVARSIEDTVRQSGLAWTILRPGGFNSNTCAWAESVRSTRTIAAPFGDVGLPTVDPVDIAEVAMTALREEGHAGHCYELTGPARITPRQQAEAIGEAIGEPVRFVEQTREQARVGMLAVMPEPVVETTLAILGEPTQREQHLSPDVERVLGRAPNTYAAWARRNAAVFR